MKRILLLYAVCLLNDGASAQSYFPLPLDSVHYWKQECVKVEPHGPGGPVYMRYSSRKEVAGDTLVSGKWYKVVVEAQLQYRPNYCGHLMTRGYLRQDTAARRVYILDRNFQEKLLYDFAAGAGDTITVYDLVSEQTFTFEIVRCDSILLGDGLHHRYQDLTHTSTIEGVGGTNGLLHPYTPHFEIKTTVLCMGEKVNKTTLYSQVGGTDCYTLPVREISPAHLVGIFPNPGNTVVRFASASEITAIKVTDMTGRTCLEVEGVSSDEYLMNLEALAAGLYIAEIETGPGLVAAKLIKE